METSVNSKCKAFTSLEQSRKLAEILPLESADMYYMETSYNNYTIGVLQRMEKNMLLNKAEYYKMFPCWSLSALLDNLKLFTTPTAFSVKVCVPLLSKTNNGYSLTYSGDHTLMDKNNLDTESPIEIVADNPIDACYEMILKLKGLNLL